MDRGAAETWRPYSLLATRYSRMEDLDALVRRVDEDRWLASRFAPPEARAKLIALYAAYYEIAHSVEVVREPALGDMRLEWWRAGVEELGEGKPARAPALEALKASGAPLSLLPAMIATRARDLDAAPFATWAELNAYVEGTAGALMRGAIAACAPGVNAERFVGRGAIAWGYTGLLRAAEHWRARARSVVPSEGSAEEMRALAREAYDAARAASHDVPAQAFAAIGYVAFVPGYLNALARGRSETPLFARHWRLVVASATGRI